MRDTLGLDDDGDPVAVRKALERSFGLRFTNREAAACRTAGDVFDLLCRRLDTDRPGRCATAMAFYRLRRALDRPGARAPGSDLAIAIRGVSARRLLAALERDTGLTMPARANAWLGNFGGLLAAAAILAPAWWILAALFAPRLNVWWLPLLAFTCGVALLRLGPGRFPDGCATLGGLARRTAGLNFGTLHEAGAKARPRDVWNALAEVLSECTHVPPAEISPATRLLDREPRAA